MNIYVEKINMSHNPLNADYLMSLKEKPFNSVRATAKYRELDFHLVLITRVCLDNNHIIHLLSKWRKENEFWFPAIFPISDERTKNWLEEKVINVKDRLLFLIEIENEYIGHVGLWHFDFENMACDIDNLIRGVYKYPGIIDNVMELLHSWARAELGIKDFYLQTLLENTPAIRLHTRLGYEVIKKVPLIQKEVDGRLEWVPAPPDYMGESERTDARMHLKRKVE
jgi:RimJ/RimL family protein N-acetyltransferase